jgi:hypothetical protein
VSGPAGSSAAASLSTTENRLKPQAQGHLRLTICECRLPDVRSPVSGIWYLVSDVCSIRHLPSSLPASSVILAQALNPVP